MSEAKKSIVVTGSSSGFGQKAVKDFADKGYQVFATMRGPTGKNATVKAELEAYSDSIHVVDMDVTHDESVKTAIASVLEKAGKIDVLLNNAGVMYLGITEAFSIAQAREQMETNYYGAMRTIQAVLPAMREARSGLIINTSSMVGQISAPYFLPMPRLNTLWKAIFRGYATKWHPSASILLSYNLAHSPPV